MRTLNAILVLWGFFVREPDGADWLHVLLHDYLIEQQTATATIARTRPLCWVGLHVCVRVNKHLPGVPADTVHRSPTRHFLKLPASHAVGMSMKPRLHEWPEGWVIKMMLFITVKGERGNETVVVGPRSTNIYSTVHRN